MNDKYTMLFFSTYAVVSRSDQTFSFAEDSWFSYTCTAGDVQLLLAQEGNFPCLFFLLNAKSKKQKVMPVSTTFCFDSAVSLAAVWQLQDVDKALFTSPE